MSEFTRNVSQYAHMVKGPIPKQSNSSFSIKDSAGSSEGIAGSSIGPGTKTGANVQNNHGRERIHNNDHNRFELFILGPGEKKVTEAPDTRTPNTSIFTFSKEDHTLANLLRAHLLKDPHVNFAGYRIPHPLFASFELRIQTDGTISPREAVVTCCKNLVQDLGQLGREFTKEFELRKMVGGGGDAAKEIGQQ